MITASSLPKEVVHIILEYSGRVKYRNGKYVNQINREDPLYECIKEKNKKDFSLVRRAQQNAETAEYYYHWAAVNGIEPNVVDHHFNYSACIFVQLKRLPDNKIFCMWFEFDSRMDCIQRCGFYKNIGGTWWYKFTCKLNNTAFFLFGRSVFDANDYFETTHVCK